MNKNLYSYNEDTPSRMDIENAVNKTKAATAALGMMAILVGDNMEALSHIYEEAYFMLLHDALADAVEVLERFV